METAGNNAGRALAISVARKLGTILVFGSAHSDVVLKPDLFERILRHELWIVGSWNSYSVPFPGREWRDIMRFIARGVLTSKTRRRDPGRLSVKSASCTWPRAPLR